MPTNPLDGVGVHFVQTETVVLKSIIARDTIDPVSGMFSPLNLRHLSFHA